MKITKDNDGYIIRFNINKRSHKGTLDQYFRISIDKEFQINIPATGDLTSLGTKQLIEALEIAIKLNNKEIEIEEKKDELL